MSGVLEMLHQDHANMSQLLNVLERQLLIFEQGGTPDYEIIESTIEYCLNYPDLKHHPIEDLIWQRMQARGVELDGPIATLLEEHQSLSVLTRRLAAAVKSVLREAEMPRDAFTTIARDFLNFYRDHIRKEDTYFFPAAMSALSAEDWSEIQAGIVYRDDPVFGDDADERFRSLRESVLEWDKGDQNILHA